MQHRSPVQLTAQRRAVYDAVVISERHPTAAEIYESVKVAQPKIAFGTVYNALHYLVKAGLLVELSFGDRASRFDGNVDRHDHLVCLRCGALADVDLRVPASDIARVAEMTGYRVRTHHVELRGLCPACTAETARPLAS